MDHHHKRWRQEDPKMWNQQRIRGRSHLLYTSGSQFQQPPFPNFQAGLFPTPPFTAPVSQFHSRPPRHRGHQQHSSQGRWSNSRKKRNIQQYEAQPQSFFHPSMLVDPWKHLLSQEEQTISTNPCLPEQPIHKGTHQLPPHTDELDVTNSQVSDQFKSIPDSPCFSSETAPSETQDFCKRVNDGTKAVQ
eukprot:gene117-3508_t